MMVVTPEKAPKSELTLSAVPEVLTQDDRSTADRFEDLLELHELAVQRGLPRLAAYYADRIIDAMVGR
jgi:hypothetical protein